MARVKYTPDKRGLREIARSAAMQAVAVEAAGRIAAWAREDDPRGEYAVRPATVTAGWDNETRAGAAVDETRRGDGAELRTLARAIEALGVEDPGRLKRYTTKSGKTRMATQAQIDNWTRGRR